jgi:hypothetical protein
MKAFEIVSERFIRFRPSPNRTPKSKPKFEPKNKDAAKTTPPKSEPKPSDVEVAQAKKIADLERQVAASQQKYRESLGREASSKFKSFIMGTLRGVSWLASPLNFIIGVAGLWFSYEVFRKEVEGLDPNSPEYQRAFGAFLTVAVSQFLLGNILTKTIAYLGAIPLLAVSGGRVGLTAIISKLSQPAIKGSLIFWINTPEGKNWLEGLLKDLLGGNFTDIGKWSKAILDLAGIDILPKPEKSGDSKTDKPPSPGSSSTRPSDSTATPSSSSKVEPVAANTKNKTWYMDLETGEISDVETKKSAVVAQGPDQKPLSNAALGSDPDLAMFRRRQIDSGKPDPLAKLYKPGQELPYLR